MRDLVSEAFRLRDEANAVLDSGQPLKEHEKEFVLEMRYQSILFLQACGLQPAHTVQPESRA